MRLPRNSWVYGAIATLLVIAVPVLIFVPKTADSTDDPWAHLPQHPEHTDHTGLFRDPLENGHDVTAACLDCHPDAGKEVMATSHWTWESGPYEMAGHDEPVYGGKANLINNFCIGINGNEPPCTACHIGYGWEDASFDFAEETNIDCLACHDNSGAYIKANAGYPAESVDLLAVAESVGNPTRENCGSCHFRGGGGDIDPTEPTIMNLPHGSYEEAGAQIFPFKVHEADQIYDGVYNYLLQPKTVGEGGYWTDFDWDQAAQLGSEIVGMEYSGEYDFAPTEMYWPTTHMVAPAKDALQCDACHTKDGSPGRLDWAALGYDGDPMYYGSREQDPDFQQTSMSIEVEGQ